MDRVADHGLGEPGRIDADPQLIARPCFGRNRSDALVDEARELATLAGVADAGPDGEHVAGFSDDADQQGHLELALLGDTRALLLLPRVST